MYIEGDIQCHPVYVPPEQSVVTSYLASLRLFPSHSVHFQAISATY